MSFRYNEEEREREKETLVLRRYWCQGNQIYTRVRIEPANLLYTREHDRCARSFAGDISVKVRVRSGEARLCDFGYACVNSTISRAGRSCARKRAAVLDHIVRLLQIAFDYQRVTKRLFNARPLPSALAKGALACVTYRCMAATR